MFIFDCKRSHFWICYKVTETAFVLNRFSLQPARKVYWSATSYRSIARTYAPSANARGREVGREGCERGREVLGIGVWGRVGESSTTAGRCFGARLGCYGWLSALSQPNGLTGLARRLNAGE